MNRGAVAAVMVAAVMVVAGCGGADLDKVMGRTDGVPVTEPSPTPRIDCDLIFPGGGADRR